MADEPVKYARGHHPNSRAALRPRAAKSRKPTRQKFRRLLVEQLRTRNWHGNTETVDFDLYASALYDYEYEKRAGAERSRLRHDLMALADRLGIGARGLGHARHTGEPDGRRVIPPEHQGEALRLLCATGIAGPELQHVAKQVTKHANERENDD